MRTVLTALSLLAIQSAVSLSAVASYPLPYRSGAEVGGCTTTANSVLAVVGIPWGAHTPMGPSCRGFRLISLRTGATKTPVLLPASQMTSQWTLDEPNLVGDQLIYLHYVRMPYHNWEIVALNLRTRRAKSLDHWHGLGVLDVGPLISRYQNMIVWVAGNRDVLGQVRYCIRTYNVLTGHRRSFACSSINNLTTIRMGRQVQFVDASMDGSTIAFLRQDSTSSNVWIENVRTGHLRELTHSGRASQVVITGPWVMWIEVGKNSVGPLMMADLRTWRIRTLAERASIEPSAGNGIVAWDDFYANRFNAMDLVTGQHWKISRLARVQSSSTTVHVVDRAVVEEARLSSNTTVFPVVGRVILYPSRNLPATPNF